MSYTLFIEAKVVDHEDDEEIASLTRSYIVEGLGVIEARATHFAKGVALLLEGVDQAKIEGN